jgi:hypothetical protein
MENQTKNSKLTRFSKYSYQFFTLIITTMHVYQSNSFITPLIKISPKKENAEKKKRKCGKLIFFVIELSFKDSQIINQTSI